MPSAAKGSCPLKNDMAFPIVSSGVVVGKLVLGADILRPCGHGANEFRSTPLQTGKKGTLLFHFRFIPAARRNADNLPRGLRLTPMKSLIPLAGCRKTQNHRHSRERGSPESLEKTGFRLSPE